ncbi:MAG: GGDEF domain-containing protein [Synergistaceae bacterium]|jgi:diguanylate cyclase (GGDEF)-like protein|nr:GGDEF domain-containing protein [Synergistaceae bacterium]
MVPLPAILLVCVLSSGAAAAHFSLTEPEKDYLASIRKKPLVLAYSFDLLYSDDGKEGRGMLVPIAGFMRKELGIEVELRKVAWKDAFDAVDDRSVDLFGLLSLSEGKRRKYITVGPLFSSGAQIVTTLGRPVGNELGLNGKKVGLLTENIVKDGLASYLYPNGNAVYYDSVSGLLDGLQSGEIDCVLAFNNTEIEIIRFPGVRHEFADQNFNSEQYLITMNEDLAPLVGILNRFLDSPAGDGFKASIEEARRDAIMYAAQKLYAWEIGFVRGRYPEIRMIEGGDMYPLSYVEKGERKGFMLEINGVFEDLTGVPIIIQDIDAGVSSTVGLIRSGRTHFALDAYTNPGFTHDPSLTYSLPVWSDNIRTYTYRDLRKSIEEAAVGTTLNGLTYIDWDDMPDRRPKIYSSRAALLGALRSGQVDVALMSEMTFNYQYTIMKDYELREFDDTHAMVWVKVACGTQNAVLNELYDAAVLLRQTLYPNSLNGWRHLSDRYKSDYIRLRESRKSILQAVAIVGAAMLAMMLYSFNRLFRYDRQISRLMMKQQTFDLVWGDLKAGRLISKGGNPIFRNWGFDLKGRENSIDEMSVVLGRDLRSEYTSEMECMKKSGSDMTVSQKMLISPKSGQKLYYRRYLHYLSDHQFMECLQDVTDEIERLDTLSTAASTDFLSRLLTRQAMNDKLLQKCGDLAEGAGRAFVIMIDIDDFKKVNDTYGHDAGDEVLKDVASIIKRIVGADGMTARWGGEEFLVMLDCADGETAKERVWEIVRAVEASETRVNGTEKIIKVTVSAGMAEMRPGRHYNASVRFSDNAMYDAKRSGKNTVRVWNARLKRSE